MPSPYTSAPEPQKLRAVLAGRALRSPHPEGLAEQSGSFKVLRHEPASGWVLRYPDSYLDAGEVEKLTDVGEQRICEESFENSKLTGIDEEIFNVAEGARQKSRFCCGYLVANAGNFDAAVF